METAGPRDHTVALDGLNLHYVEWGEPTSPPMVLLHGFMAHARTWDLFARDLARDYRVLALDQRGHGDTGPVPDDRYTTEDYVRDLERFVDALGLARFVLVGMSMGGRNAIVYTARHPERVERLVIVDIGPEPPPPSPPRRDAPEDPGVFDSVSQVADFLRAQDPYPPEDYRQEVARHSVRQRPDGRWEWKWAPGLLRGWGGEWDHWADLRAIPCPTLVVRGAESPVLPRPLAERMVQALRDGRLVEVERSGHAVQEDNAPALIAAVREFLGRSGRR
jgi:pimeloyl-ACP methyl ester carboxylesterase